MFDASFVSAMLLRSQYDAVAANVVREAAELAAPEILRQEVHHLVLNAERRHGWPKAESTAVLRAFEDLPFRFHYDSSWIGRAFELARELQTGLFDTVYLVAALDLDAELWTLDLRFVRAASSRFGDHIRTLP